VADAVSQQRAQEIAPELELCEERSFSFATCKVGRGADLGDSRGVRHPQRGEERGVDVAKVLTALGHGKSS